MAKITPPSITETAFDCPHCGAFAAQFWLVTYASEISGGSRTPKLLKLSTDEVPPSSDGSASGQKPKLVGGSKEERAGLVYLESVQYASPAFQAKNLHISSCFNCKKASVWIHEKLMFPFEQTGIPPNPDLPDDILRDFNEARSIVGESPRGAAALLRLCVQKLCAELGESGEDINQDIKHLVAKGLSPLIQKSLDTVRVIGNEAVHPGVLDLRDDIEAAMGLFQLINLIVEQMISTPKHVQTMYDKLPPPKVEAIEKRDAKKKEPK